MNEFLLKFRFGVGKRINMYERLQSFSEDGFSIFETLQRFKLRYTKRKDFRAQIVDKWLEKMKHGSSFNDALMGWVPEAERNLIAAGERGEGVHLGLKEAVRFTMAAARIKSAIKMGAAYPSILLSMILVFVAAFSKYMAPTFLFILPVDKWPPMASALYFASTFLVKYWFFIILFIVGVCSFVGYTIPRWVGRIRSVFDHAPPWSIYRSYQASAFLISLASMMRSGVPLNEALKAMRKNAEPWLAIYLDKMFSNLKKGGKNYGLHLDVGLLDEETAGDVVDYSELGKFETAIYAIGERNLETGVIKINLQMNVAKNLMLMVVAFTVGWIYYVNADLSTTIAEVAATSTTAASKK